jgi:hypothetical protein
MPYRRSSSSFKPSYSKSYSSKSWSTKKSYETKKGFSLWSSKPKTVINKTTIVTPGYGPSYYAPHYVPIVVPVGVTGIAAAPVHYDSDFDAFDFLGLCLVAALIVGVFLWFVNRG